MVSHEEHQDNPNLKKDAGTQIESNLGFISFQYRLICPICTMHWFFSEVTEMVKDLTKTSVERLP